MDLQQFIAECERKLTEAESANLANAPFGMDADEARCWFQGRAAVLQWTLEMLTPQITG